MEMTISIMHICTVQALTGFLLVRSSLFATMSKKVTIITHFHNLQLSSVILKVIHFLFSRINNLRTAISSICSFYHVAPPPPLEKPRDIAFILSETKRIQRWWVS